MLSDTRLFKFSFKLLFLLYLFQTSIFKYDTVNGVNRYTENFNVIREKL